MNKNDDSSNGTCAGPRRDRQNQVRVTLWALAWALSFTGVTLGIKREWWPFGGTLAGVVTTALLGIATVWAYRRFLDQTDELRRKIEVEALALAFGVGAVGGLSYWLLAVSGAVPALGFAYVFVAMIVTHPVGVLLGGRRYS